MPVTPVGSRSYPKGEQTDFLREKKLGEISPARLRDRNNVDGREQGGFKEVRDRSDARGEGTNDKPFVEGIRDGNNWGAVHAGGNGCERLTQCRSGDRGSF